MREGDARDRYLLIETRSVHVSAASRHLRTCAPRDCIREIALLRYVPLTATVVATEPTLVLSLYSSHSEPR